MNSNYERIKDLIKEKKFEESKKKEWGGADTLVISNPNDKRVDDYTLTVFVTKNATSVIWLIEELKKVAKIDYLSKLIFYPKLARSGIEYEKENGDSNVEGLLLYMLDSIKEFI